jgi:hypothetical protein
MSGTTDGSFEIVSTGDFTATVNPFDSGNGTLNSFEVMWNIAFSAEGTTGGNGGEFTGSTGGTYSLAGIGYDGNGGGNSDGNTPDMPVSFTFQVSGDSTFLVADAGITYNPAMLPAVTGGSPFDLLWATDYSLSPSGLSTWTGGATGNVSIVYDYDPAPAPEPSTFVLFGGGLLALAAVKRYRGQRRGTIQA